MRRRTICDGFPSRYSRLGDVRPFSYLEPLPRASTSVRSESRVGAIAGGTSEVQANIIAQRILGLPR